jgi:hypothetical protein
MRVDDTGALVPPDEQDRGSVGSWPDHPSTREAALGPRIDGCLATAGLDRRTARNGTDLGADRLDVDQCGLRSADRADRLPRGTGEPGAGGPVPRWLRRGAVCVGRGRRRSAAGQVGQGGVDSGRICCDERGGCRRPQSGIGLRWRATGPSLRESPCVCGRRRSANQPASAQVASFDAFASPNHSYHEPHAPGSSELHSIAQRLVD